MTLIKARECAEEMRIFYVAMTRPMEKLYLTGCETADYANTISKSCDSLNLNSLRLPYSVRCSKNGYMYWVECCYARLKALATSDFSDSVRDEAGKELFKNAAEFIIRQEYGFKELEKHIQRSVIGKTLNFESLIKEAKAYAYDKRVLEIKDEINFKYAYEPFTKIKNKYSISEIKKMMADEVSADDVDGERQDKVSTVEAGETVENSSKEKNTDTAKSTGKISASERGTLVHKFLELLDFAALTEDLAENDYSALVKETLEALEDEGIYTEEEKGVIPVKKIAVFLTSSLGQRMIRAAKRNELFREKSFTKTFPVNELLKNEEVPGENDETILVQGTIDAYFFEDEKAVLVDYKTDHKTPKQLIGLYHAQLEYYAKTIEALLDREVCERLIYSFHNNCEVRIPV
jgi:ATP-dependent helicase/nuclease subunit A